MTTFLWCLAFFLVTASVLLFLGRGGWPRPMVGTGDAADGGR